MTCDSYFTILVEVFTNHTLAENTYFTNHIERTEHTIVVLKPANKYQIIRCHSFITILINDFFMSKRFVKINFYGAENDKLPSRNNSPFKSLLTI